MTESTPTTPDDSGNMPNWLIPDKLYQILKWVALTVLPALAVLVGVLGGFTGWLTQHLSRRRNMVTRQDLQAFAAQLEKGDRHFRVLDEQDRDLRAEMRDMKIIMLRQCLFARPRDRNSHESMLQSGEEYVKLGGNGVGHIRLTQLQEEYALRLQTNDWDYSHPAKEIKS